MTVDKYLKNKLKKLGERNYIPLKENTRDEVISILTRKNRGFRKWSINESVYKRINKALDLTYEKGKPIRFTFPFGGYKLWSLDSYPYPDWAEYFFIQHILDYLSPISQVYKPGIEIYFTSADGFIPFANNVPREDTTKYFKRFEKLLSFFREYLPKNVKVEITRDTDLFPSLDDYYQDLKDAFIVQKKNLLQKDPAELEKQLTTSDMNINWNGVKDWDKLSEEMKNEKRLDGICWHNSHGSPTRNDWVKGDDKILLFSQPIPTAIPIGSTKASIAKFWVGVGVLEKIGDKYVGKILSPTQYEAVEKNIKTEQVSIFDAPGFNQIKVLDCK